MVQMHWMIPGFLQLLEGLCFLCRRFLLCLEKPFPTCPIRRRPFLMATTYFLVFSLVHLLPLERRHCLCRRSFLVGELAYMFRRVEIL